jgi:hypothetical protein
MEGIKMSWRKVASVCVLLVLFGCSKNHKPTYDVVIYGGTSAGVTAAMQSARFGKKVILVEPGEYLGGLTSGGLGATDIGNKAAIGGISRDFYRHIKRHYDRDESWIQQSRDSYQSRRQSSGEDTMWTFEPHVAEKILHQMVAESGAELLFGERLDREQGVEKAGSTITAITTQTGKRFDGHIFIDATYEGDLLAAAGVTYYVGRESNSVYGETLNGIQTRNAVYHQFRFPVDPYRNPGDPNSGLLPYIHGGDPGEEGTGDSRVQAYNFRLCLTDVIENQIPFSKPSNYDPLNYELLFRNFEAGEDRIPWINTPMPNRKTDINNYGAFSSDYIGMNYDYPEADYQRREQLVEAHRDYQMGLMWALANEPRVPEPIRSEVARWGLAKDEFVKNGGWPHQIYVREARRMVGEYVMTQHNCQGRRKAPDPVGLAAYTMDSHNVQRYVSEGKALNEGDVQVGGFPPYPIAYGAIIPKREECSNLLVPVCLSASHIAFGSIRMEPVFMVLGQSAAVAACQSIDEENPVQAINRDALKQSLIEMGQFLEWKEPES